MTWAGDMAVCLFAVVGGIYRHTMQTSWDVVDYRLPTARCASVALPTHAYSYLGPTRPHRLPAGHSRTQPAVNGFARTPVHCLNSNVPVIPIYVPACPFVFLSPVISLYLTLWCSRGLPHRVPVTGT